MLDSRSPPGPPSRPAGTRVGPEQSFLPRLFAASALFVAATAACAQACGSLENAYGPWDYRKDRGEPLRLVESAHFNAQVESLIRGITTTNIGGDIHYTLKAFPNHHRALLSAMRLGERAKSDKPPGMLFTVECYFDRAIRWRPDDLTVRMIYAGWLNKRKRLEDASKQMAYVVAQAQDNPFTHYNAGLVYLELKDYDAALKQAHRAIELGFTRMELRDRLKAEGKWVDPQAGAASAAEAGAVPAAGAASQPADKS